MITPYKFLIIAFVFGLIAAVLNDTTQLIGLQTFTASAATVALIVSLLSAISWGCDND